MLPGLLVFDAIAAFFLLRWPTLLTLLTLLTFPILLVMYARLAISEEAEMHKQFGAEFETYAARTPRFVPSLRNEHSTA